MIFCGLPGGSPGPHAQATWPMLIAVFLLALTVAGGLCWLIIYAANFA